MPSAALHYRPAHGRERVADVVTEGPAPVEQESVRGPDHEAGGRGGEVPDAEALQQDRVDDEREQRVGHADDPELDELDDDRPAQMACGIDQTVRRPSTAGLLE